MRAILQTLLAGAILLVSAFASMGQQVLIDDFTSGSQKNWRFFADTVMGGISTGKLDFVNEDGTSYARLRGRVSTANNGGFIQMRRDLKSAPSANTKGVRLMVRGCWIPP